MWGFWRKYVIEAGIGSELVVSKPHTIVSLLFQSLVLIIPDVSSQLLLLPQSTIPPSWILTLWDRKLQETLSPIHRLKIGALS